jgi:ABC-2 type transport system permease protein
MLQRIREIVRKEFRQALREPRMRVLLFLPPLIQLLIFGYAVNLDVEDTRIAWMDQDHTPESRDLLGAFRGASRYFRIAAVVSSDSEVQDLLDRGDVQAVVRVLPGFAREVKRGRTAAVQVLVDGTNSNTASLVSSYAVETIAEWGAKGTQQVSGPSPQTRVWFNPELRSRNYFVPGVVVNIVALVSLMLTALAIVREKEIGTMEQLMVTPIRPVELMIGKTLPFALVGIVDVALITTAALVIFGIPFRGSVVMLFGCAMLFLLTTLGAGLFISTISNTQQQAMMSSFFFFMPAFMLSGFAFPIRNMPVAVQWLTYLDPVRYFIEIVRGIFLKGTGVRILWPQMAALAVYGVVVLGSSALRFHKRLD